MRNQVDEVINGKYENHVLPFFWQKDGTSDQQIIDYIEKMNQSDIHAFCVESRPFTGFLQADWWTRMTLILREAKKRDMKVWILDDFHFPTGYANGAVKDHPELRKRVLKHHIVNAVGPTRNLALHYHQPYPEDPTAEFFGAVAIQGDQAINLNHEIVGDCLYFGLPQGRWDIFVMTISTQTDVAEDYINMVDKRSCRLLIDTVYEAHYQHFKSEFGNTIAGFFSDEPGFQNEKGNKSDSLIGKDMPLPWSDEVVKALQQEMGSNYMLKLPHLWRDIDQITPRIRQHYMDIVTRLYKQDFSEQIGNWCRDHSVEYIGHIIEDRESHARLGVGPGHYYRALAGQDMAGSDIISNQLMPGLNQGYNTWARGKWDGEFFHYMIARMTSSLAHITPRMKGRAMCEVFGAYGWHEGIPLMKWIIDHQVAQGINYFVPHAFSPTEFPDPDCPPHFYAQGHNPQFRYFGRLMRYTNQLCSIFSGGKTVPSVALLYHGEAEWTGQYMSSQEPARVLTQHQVDFDIVPSDVFEIHSEYDVDLTQELQINGQNYPFLVIPYSEYISKSLYHFITATSHTTVIFLEKYPTGFSDSTELFDLGLLKINSQVTPLTGLSTVINLEKLNIVNLSEPQPNLTVYHYLKETSNFYLLLNEDPIQPIETEITIPGMSQLVRSDLLTGESYELQDGQLSLAPLESCLITDEMMEIHSMESKKYEHRLELNIDPVLSLATAEQYPKFDQPQCIEGYPDISRTVKPGFSGTMRYLIRFKSDVNSDQAKVSLKQVHEIADVYLNGKLLGTRICEPYCFQGGKISRGENELIVDVTNTLDKQVYEKHSAAVVVQPSGLLAPPIIEY